MWHVMPVYLQAQTAVLTHLTNLGYFDRRKNPNTPIGTPCPDKNGAGSGISDLCGFVTYMMQSFKMSLRSHKYNFQFHIYSGSVQMYRKKETIKNQPLQFL